MHHGRSVGHLAVCHALHPAAVIRHWDSGVVWLPLFLATCLFFASTIDTNTGRVVFWYVLAVRLSGLLPGEGYSVVCAMLYYTLFFSHFRHDRDGPEPQDKCGAALATPSEPARAQLLAREQHAQTTYLSLYT